MATIRLDIANTLNQYINSKANGVTSKIGILGEDDSIALMQTPGGNEVPFYDGSRMKSMNFNIMAKDEDPSIAPEFLSFLFQELELLQTLPSQNGSYDFYGIDITSLPSLVAMDNRGYAIYQLSIAVNILIHKGVGL